MYQNHFTNTWFHEINRFPGLSRTSGLFAGLSSPGKRHNEIPGLSRFSRTRTNSVPFIHSTRYRQIYSLLQVAISSSNLPSKDAHVRIPCPLHSDVAFSTQLLRWTGGRTHSSWVCGFVCHLCSHPSPYWALKEDAWTALSCSSSTKQRSFITQQQQNLQR